MKNNIKKDVLAQHVLFDMGKRKRQSQILFFTLKYIIECDFVYAVKEFDNRISCCQRVLTMQKCSYYLIKIECDLFMLSKSLTIEFRVAEELNYAKNVVTTSLN